MIGSASNGLQRYLLEGNNDPWMFHQANTRDYDGAGHSLFSDLLDAAFAKYEAAATSRLSVSRWTSSPRGSKAG